MELFAVHLVRPPACALGDAELAEHVARALEPRVEAGESADTEHWGELSRKRLGVVRGAKPKGPDTQRWGELSRKRLGVVRYRPPQA